jgi:hypothetical protein
MSCEVKLEIFFCAIIYEIEIRISGKEKRKFVNASEYSFFNFDCLSIFYFFIESLIFIVALIVLSIYFTQFFLFLDYLVAQEQQRVIEFCALYIMEFLHQSTQENLYAKNKSLLELFFD